MSVFEQASTCGNTYSWVQTHGSAAKNEPKANEVDNRIKRHITFNSSGDRDVAAAYGTTKATSISAPKNGDTHRSASILSTKQFSTSSKQYR